MTRGERRKWTRIGVGTVGHLRQSMSLEEAGAELQGVPTFAWNGPIPWSCSVTTPVALAKCGLRGGRKKKSPGTYVRIRLTSRVAPGPMLNCPESTVTCSALGCQW